MIIKEISSVLYKKLKKKKKIKEKKKDKKEKESESVMHYANQSIHVMCSPFLYLGGELDVL